MNSNPNAGSDQDLVDALYRLTILDTGPEKEFDDIAALAATVCNAPIAVIGFTDKNRFWFKSKCGGNELFTEIPGRLAFGDNARRIGDVIIVEDTVDDKYLDANPALREQGIRFMACVPIVNEDGVSLGYLCVFDRTPRQLGPEQISSLLLLKGQVVTLLSLRLHVLKNKVEDYRAGEDQMKTIFQNSIDAVVVTDVRDVIVQWNDKAEDIFGWKEDEVKGKRFRELCNVKILFETLSAQPPNTPNKFDVGRAVEATASGKNKKTLEIALSVSPAIIRERAYYIIFINDITEQKHAARELDKQKEFYENILNSIPTDIAVFDADHKYIFVNPTAIRNDELRKFIIGKDDFEYSEYRKRDLSGARLRREKFLEAKSQRKEIRWEDSLIGPAGTPMTHLRRMFPVHNEHGELLMVIGFGMDITERKEMEEKQSSLLQQLSVQNTQLIDFCNIVSHNLRAPLVNMSLLVEFIEGCEDLEEQKQLISRLNPVLDNLNTTFNELVESIQIKQDLEIQSENINLEDYLLRTLESLEPEINQSSAIFEVDLEQASVIHYPAKYLNSIFQNLVSNALKYKSPERNPVIRISTKKVNNSVILEVADNGLGIDLKRHRKNFFKIGKVFHHHPNAKGFGLFMIKTHIEAMGGRIWVESAPEKGATFFVEFINQHLCKP